MSKTIENLKSGNYEVVDNQGVSVTEHFVECLEKEFGNLEAKLAKNKKWLASNEGFLENEKLKEQLAEKDKAIANWEYMYEGVVQSCHNSIEEDNRLEKLLAEKDKELKRIKKNWELSKGQQRRLYDSLKLRCKDALEQIDKDKISFAIEQLENVKGKIQHNVLFVDCDDYVDVMEEINNQIRQLKGKR